jgi:hypothetical protein
MSLFLAQPPIVTGAPTSHARPRVLFAYMVGWLLSCAPVAAQSQPFEETIAETRGSFQPVTQENVLQAVSKVRQGLHAVEAYVVTEGQNSAAWKRFLDWDEQKDRLNHGGGPDAGYWKSIYRRVSRNEAGLEHTSFQQYRKAVRELSEVMDAASSPDQSEQFEATLNQLAALLQSPHDMPEADHADRISVLLGDLASQQQAEKLRGAVRQQYNHPNVVLRLPEQLLKRMRNEPIEVDFPVNDFIGGAAVRGTSHLSATRSMSLVPSTSHLKIRTEIVGTSYSTTTATKDRVTVNTAGDLRFNSTAEIYFDRKGFALAPFKTNAELRTRITRVNSDYFLRRRRAAGVREAYARRESDRRQAERNAITGLSAEFDKQLAKSIAGLQNDYREQFYRPLVRLDQVPDMMRFRTEAGAATMEMLFADSTQLGVRRPADLSGDSEWMRGFIHQSAINNFATILSGQTEELDVALRRFLSAGDPVADQQPERVRITFADRRPLRVAFQDDEMTLALSGKAYEYRKQRYSGMDIKLRYRLETSGATPEFVLLESPEVLMPMRSDGRRQRGGVRSITLRRILTNVLERDVPKSIVLDKVPLPQPANFLGEFALERVRINDGWLTLDARPVSVVEPAKNGTTIDSVAAGYRTWTDNTGHHQVVASLESLDGNHVRLRKEGGRFTTVPLNRLGLDELHYVQRLSCASE